MPASSNPRLTSRIKFAALGLGVLAIVGIVALAWVLSRDRSPRSFQHVSTLAGTGGEFGEPFGIAVRGKSIYVSDGQAGKIWRIEDGTATVYAEGLNTPSGIAFNDRGDLIVADAGSHTIMSVNSKSEVSTLAGTIDRPGFADGDAASALFKGPVGVAVGTGGEIYVADTYNDRIRVIRDDQVTTAAGSTRGYAEGQSEAAKFNTPCGLALWNDKLLVADAGNHRLRVVEPDGGVWTLAGSGEASSKDGLLFTAAMFQPTAVTTGADGSIYFTDGNAVRRISAGPIPFVRTLTDERRGLKDGSPLRARFNRPSGLALDADGQMFVADSDNRLVRRFARDRAKNSHEITPAEIAELRETPETFRVLADGRWPYDPPAEKRDIAGTLGEIRGEMRPGDDDVWFHNGLDIAGAYGETARFIRGEKVLLPLAAQNYGTLRELIRMPSLGYIHIRLGRGPDLVPFGDHRFLFDRDASGKVTDVRVPRGAAFRAGEPIGTLNAMNHVHLIAGRSGSEMNALDALTLPGITDTRPPVIEKVSLFTETWQALGEGRPPTPIVLSGRVRIVARAFDQMDGNPDRRRLGVYRLGYQVLTANGVPLTDTVWGISLERFPPPEAVRYVYANGSRSGATGVTIFDYIVTNTVAGDEFREGFLDAASLGPGSYIVRVSAADRFGNVTTSDVTVKIAEPTP